MYVAPFSPHRGLVTSHITVNVQSSVLGSSPDASIPRIRIRSSPHPFSSCPCSSRKRTPSALIQPIPPSLVAEPPMAIEISRNPWSSASRINSPVPNVVVFRGSRCFSGIRVRPDADAISMTALLSSSFPKNAVSSSQSGPCTFTEILLPPAASVTASAVPSPPSATSTPIHSHPGKISRAACVSSSAVLREERDPLKESDANKNFIVSILTSYVISITPGHIGFFIRHFNILYLYFSRLFNKLFVRFL